MAATKRTTREELIKDISGKRFGRLTVISLAGSIGGKSIWLCICDCGTTKKIFARHLPRITSCGCYQKELFAAKSARAYSNTPEYATWSNAKGRCFNPRDKRYPLYGGRGITMCDEWRYSYSQFLEDMGPRPAAGMSLDRIDVNGPYSKANCRWATQKEQMRNTRQNIRITVNGETHTAPEWAEITGLTWSAIYHRHKRGKPLFTARQKRRLK